jgi:hypothetical protein
MAMPDVSTTCYPLVGFCFSNKFDLALIVSVLLFLLGNFYNSHRERKKQRETRKRYLFALKSEIAFNSEGLQKTISAFPPQD